MMPRPGPRPYDCLRRAWHSERHQPIRGSFIQEIFRVANEIHSPTTKKNKEWQEKLPIVVLKAEEIMYSKANSEAEYMDLKTLWDRMNDAINTIIRRDESSEETGEFLQPCIEAALHLGCIPRKASRSQRNNHPRGYLTATMDLPNATKENPKTTSSLTPQHHSNFLGKEPNYFVVPINNSIPNEIPFLSTPNCLHLESSFSSRPCPIYPLYYGIHCPPTSNSMGNSQKLSLCDEENKRSIRPPLEVSKNPPRDNECDLSLRLGFGSAQDGENNCRREERFSVTRGENFDLGLMIRKRKAAEPMKDERYSWQPNKFLSSYFNGGTRTPGL